MNLKTPAVAAALMASTTATNAAGDVQTCTLDLTPAFQNHYWDGDAVSVGASAGFGFVPWACLAENLGGEQYSGWPVHAESGQPHPALPHGSGTGCILAAGPGCRFPPSQGLLASPPVERLYLPATDYSLSGA